MAAQLFEAAKRRTVIVYVKAGLIIGCLSAIGLPLHAQNAGNEGAFDLGRLVLNADQGFDQLEEERTIKTFDAEEIEKQDINTLSEALDNTPNVVVTGESSPRSFNITVRGLSDVGNVNATGPTVGLFVDGVLLNQVGASASFNPGLVDVERVDVFLGPQTTTFSRATTAGAVNVVTKKPTDEFELSFEGDLGALNDNPDFSGSASFVANAPILRDGLLSGRIAAYYSASEGFVDVVGVPGADRLSNRVFGSRVSLRSRPREDLTFDLQFNWMRIEYDAPLTTTPVALIEQGIYQSFIDPAGTDTNDDYVLRFEAAYDSEVGVFKSNSSYRSSDTLLLFDGDFIPTINLTDSEVTLRTTSLSQDFRFEGAPMDLGPGTLTVNAGLSVSYNEFFASDRVSVANGLAGRLITDDRLETLGVSVYGDASWRPTPKLELSAGLRFAYDRVKTTDLTVATGPLTLTGDLFGFPLIAAERNFTTLLPSAAISYDWTDELTTFVAYSVGYRPGGISEVAEPGNMGQPLTTLDFFDRELTQSLELGVRVDMLDEQLTLNATAFYTQIDNFQAPVTRFFPGAFFPPSTVLANAGDAESYGGEISVSTVPHPGWVVQGSLGVNFTEITDFSGTLIGFTPATSPDLTGSDLPNAPRYTYTFAAEYEHPTALVNGLKPFLRVDYNFRSSFLSGGLNSLTRLDGYDTVDLRLGLRGETARIELFAENLFNERYTTTSTANPVLNGPIPFMDLGLPPVAAGVVGVPGTPRRIGIRGKIEF